MTDGAGFGESNVVRFPGSRRARLGLEAIAVLAPSRSLVESFLAERGELAHDAWAGFAREFACQARGVEAGEGRDAAVCRVRGLADAHIAHAAELCRRYRDAADRLVALEIRMAREERIMPADRLALARAREGVRGPAIAARYAADAALGAAAALAAYIREGLDGLPVSEAEPRQLLLFATG